MMLTNETRLNTILDQLPDNVAQSLFTKKLPVPSKIRSKQRKNIAPTVTKLVNQLGLLDEPNYTNRLYIFLGYCKLKKYSFHTVSRYFQELRSAKMFGDTLLVPDKSQFQIIKYIKLITRENFLSLVKYLHDHFSKYTAPILVGFYTGLRTMEILQMSLYTLFQLQNKLQYIDIIRKQTARSNTPTNWKPVYTQYFTNFISELIKLYEDEYNTFLTTKVNKKLFYITTKTLVNRVHVAYFNATHTLPPKGFGIHSFRYAIASWMAHEGTNITTIQNFLQHKSIKTSKIYIKDNMEFIQHEFDRLTNKDLFHVRKTLQHN